MLKNINDYISLISLFLLAFLSLRAFIWCLLPSSTEKEAISKYEKFLDYINNEEE